MKQYEERKNGMTKMIYISTTTCYIFERRVDMMYITYFGPLDLRNLIAP